MAHTESIGFDVSNTDIDKDVNGRGSQTPPPSIPLRDDQMKPLVKWVLVLISVIWLKFAKIAYLDIWSNAFGSFVWETTEIRYPGSLITDLPGFQIKKWLNKLRAFKHKYFLIINFFDNFVNTVT